MAGFIHAHQAGTKTTCCMKHNLLLRRPVGDQRKGIKATLKTRADSRNHTTHRRSRSSQVRFIEHSRNPLWELKPPSSSTETSLVKALTRTSTSTSSWAVGYKALFWPGGSSGFTYDSHIYAFTGAQSRQDRKLANAQHKVELLEERARRQREVDARPPPPPYPAYWENNDEGGRWIRKEVNYDC